jgi:hypothetical protein
MMNKIKLFEDFLVEKFDTIKLDKITEKDYYDILDLFLEYIDEYNMYEYNIDDLRDDRIYYKLFLDEKGNGYGIILEIYFDRYSENFKKNINKIIDQMRSEFIPRLKKWGYLFFKMIQSSADINPHVYQYKLRYIFYKDKKI